MYSALANGENGRKDGENRAFRRSGPNSFHMTRSPPRAEIGAWRPLPARRFWRWKGFSPRRGGALAASIDALGLLHPIVVAPFPTTDRTGNYQLVAGLRRLEACKKLDHDMVNVRILHVGQLLQAEHDENVVRKDFTTSERVAIATAIREQMGGRQGQRTDKLVGNGPQVEGEKTRDVAATKSGVAPSGAGMSIVVFPDAKTATKPDPSRRLAGRLQLPSLP